MSCYNTGPCWCMYCRDGLPREVFAYEITEHEKKKELKRKNEMRDWQDKEQEKEDYIDKKIASISTEDLVKALDRRQEKEIQQLLKDYENKLRKNKK